MSLVLSNKGKGMQSSSEQPLVGEERYVTTRITAAKETRVVQAQHFKPPRNTELRHEEKQKSNFLFNLFCFHICVFFSGLF